MPFVRRDSGQRLRLRASQSRLAFGTSHRRPGEWRPVPKDRDDDEVEVRSKKKRR